MAKYSTRNVGNGKFEDCCIQELSERSCSMCDNVTFDELIAELKKKKKSYQYYIDEGSNLQDYYLEGRCRKFVKFDSIKLECNYWNESPSIRIMGYRKLDEIEVKLKEQEEHTTQEKQRKERQAQYEKLKQEFDK